MESPRHGTAHDVPACWFGVDRSTVTRAIGEVRPLLARRGRTVAPGARLRTLAEVVEYLGLDGRTGIIDGTEIRVRRPAAGLDDRDQFVSGKTQRNAVKTMVLTHAAGVQDPGRGRSRRPATAAARHALRRLRLRPRHVPPAPAAARDPAGDRRTWPATRHRSGHLLVGGRAHDLLAAFHLGWRPAFTVLGRQGRGCSTPTTRSAGRPCNGAGLRVLADHDGLAVDGDDEPGPRALCRTTCVPPRGADPARSA